MVAWSALKQHKQNLIRKALDGSAFIAPSSAAAITALTSGASAALAALPTGYADVGLIEGGVTYSIADKTSDVTSWGVATPTRQDVISRDTTVKFVCQETNIQTLQLYLGADLSAVTSTPSTGELALAVAAAPVPKYYRFLTISVDQDPGGAGDIYLARFLPRASVTAVDDQTHNDEGAITYGFTIEAHVDDTLGYAVEHIFAGPGWKALLVSMGFPAAT